MKHGEPQESDFVMAEKNLKNFITYGNRHSWASHQKFMDCFAMQCNKCGDFEGSVTPWRMMLRGSIKYLPRMKPTSHGWRTKTSKQMCTKKWKPSKTAIWWRKKLRHPSNYLRGFTRKERLNFVLMKEKLGWRRKGMKVDQRRYNI
jgi:hypothetical protein